MTAATITPPGARTAPPRPMVASSGPVPRAAGWGFEFAWDGLRCLAHAGDDGLRLVTDAGRDVTSSFPELGVLAGRGLVLDGVVVALDPVGRPSAAKLRHRHRVAHPSEILQSRIPVAFYVFDVLEVDGTPTVRLPYHRRRELLAELELAGGKVVVPPSFAGVDADAVVDTARRYGLDGVVAKRLESTYQSGRRSRSWIETPVRRAQEVVVGGWVPSARGEDGPERASALLVGVPTEAGLRYAGRVVTGVTAAARRELDAAAAGLERRESPFAGEMPDDGRARWLLPRLVGSVEHRRWTPTGLLERPAWQGLRAGTHPAMVQSPILAAPVVESDLDLDGLDRVEGRRTSEILVAPTQPTPEDAEPALRSRFSAHFVHNTLTAIASYVRTDPSRARELLGEFADFTRYSFRSGGDMTTVGEELDNVERYLSLEHARFGVRLRSEVITAPEVATVAVPPFVVAPLVENAVRLGIEPMPDGGTISVVAASAGTDCVITVWDDGAGMGPDAIRATSRPDGRSWGEHADRGIAEVSRRLRSVYGPRCDVSVDTRPGTGTAVRLRVPTAGARAAHSLVS